MHPQPFPGFMHFPTHHCVTGSLRHIYALHGYPVSEELLLGLGAGVGFIYWHMKGALPFIGGRANLERPGEEGLEKTVGRRTGVQVNSFHTDSAARAEKALLVELAAGRPVMLVLDMGFLPYFDFGGKEYHFGYHVVVACGYDPQDRQVLLADRDEALHPVSLAAARGRRAAQPSSPFRRTTPGTRSISAGRILQSPATSWQPSANAPGGCWSRPSPISASRAFARRLDAFKPGGTPWARTTCARRALTLRS